MTYAALFTLAVVAACGTRDRAPIDSAALGASVAAKQPATDTIPRDTATTATPASIGAMIAQRATQGATSATKTSATKTSATKTSATKTSANRPTGQPVRGAGAATSVPPAPRRDTAPPPSATALPQQDVDREIARAVVAWRNVRTLRATFQQIVLNPITGSELTSRGQLQQQKPGKLAITFSDPFGDRIVSDGEFVWVYLQSATPGQVVRMRVTDVGAANTDLIGQFLTTPRAKYDASDAGADRVGDRPARAITLAAKPGQSLPFIRAKVWVDAKDALIRQFEAVDANGISRKVRILTMSPNATVDQAAFRFDVPPGVRIIER